MSIDPLSPFQPDQASTVARGAALPIGRSGQLTPFRAPHAGDYVLVQPDVWERALRRVLRSTTSLPATAIANATDQDWPLADTAYVLAIGGGRYLWTIPHL